MLSTHIWFIFFLNICRGEIPIVLNTWQFTQATEKVWQLLNQNVVDAVDAVTMGTSVCEELQCDHTVGYGGSPDENGETTLDALIFDGSTIDMGAVAGLRRVKDAARVARHVLKYTSHSFLVGDLATEFAKNLGFKEESLRTNYSLDLYTNWRSQNCQPNFWKNVEPDPRRSCGPYHPTISNEISEGSKFFNSQNHDTIGMIVIDRKGDIVAGTSTNGANHKIPGRVGDSPIPGAGAYADNEVGAAVATGDGDLMMRFLPSFLAVEEMRRGETPTRAARIAIERIAKRYPTYFGAVLAVNSKGVYGAACNGMEEFPFSVADSSQGAVSVMKVKCVGT